MSRPPSSGLSIPLPPSRSPSAHSSPLSTTSRESRISFEEPPEWNVQHEPSQTFTQSDYLNAVEPPIVPTPRPFSTASHRSLFGHSYLSSNQCTIRTLPFPPSAIIIEPPSEANRNSNSDFTPLPPSHSSPHHQCDCRLTPTPRSDIYILPSLPPIDPHPSIDIRVVAIEGRGSTPSSTGAISVPPPPPTQAWVTGKPSSSTPQQGLFRKVFDRISSLMCTCLDRVKSAHARVKNTFGIPDEPPFYLPEPERISPRDPPPNETEDEKEKRLTKEARHMEYLMKLRAELNGFTSNTIIYHGTPDGDELVTYCHPRPKDVPTPGSEPLKK